MLLVSYCAAGLTLILITLAMDGIWSEEIRRNGAEIRLAVMLAVLVKHSIAVFLITRDDRGRAVPRIRRVLRWVLRLATISPILGVGWGLATFLLPPLTWRSLGFAIDPWWFLDPLLICPALTFFRLRELALRLSRPRLAEHVTIVATGSAVSLLYVVVATIVTMHSSSSNNVPYLFATIVMPWVFVWLFDLWALLLLFVVVRKFGESAKEAGKRWILADASIVKSG
jgi:hypothetical protein